MVIWITGISGAGKTTLCDALSRLVKPRLPELVVIDGDVVREIFGGGLGYSEPERVQQIKRIQRLAQELDRQGLVVLVAAVYSHADLLAWNRRNFRDYFEIYLDASLALVQKRDAKGLYRKAAEDQMPCVVGIDIPWNAPVSADFRIDADRAPDPENLAAAVAARVPRLAACLPDGMLDMAS